MTTLYEIEEIAKYSFSTPNEVILQEKLDQAEAMIRQLEEENRILREQLLEKQNGTN